MPVPSTQEIRKPLLEAFKGEAPRNFAINDFMKLIADYFGENLDDMSSGDKNTFKQRLNEARMYLRKKHLLSNPSKSTYMLTKLGREIIEEDPEEISDEYLEERTQKTSPLEDIAPVPETPPAPLPTPDPAPLPEPELPEEFTEPELPEEIPDEPQEPEQEQEQEDEAYDDEQPPEEAEQEEAEPETFEELEEPEDMYDAQPQEEEEQPADPETEYEPEPEAQEVHEEPEFDYDPEELHRALSPTNNIEDVVAKYNSHLADEVLMKTAGIPSDMFEVLVIDLLSKMGYRAFQNARYNNEETGDDLIQGVILDKKNATPIYIHARKLSPGRTVGRADVQDFAEVLSERGGTGIFATTAAFSENAKTYAADERIMLIDGAKLAGLMIAHNFCVNVEKVFEVKAIDPESFSEYEQ